MARNHIPTSGAAARVSRILAVYRTRSITYGPRVRGERTQSRGFTVTAVDQAIHVEYCFGPGALVDPEVQARMLLGYADILEEFGYTISVDGMTLVVTPGA